MSFLKELIIFLLSPINTLVSPKSAGAVSNKRYALQGGGYALLILALIGSFIAYIMPNVVLTPKNELQFWIFVAGILIAMPCVFLALSVLLHFNRPTHEKEWRFRAMLALPWHMMASFSWAITIFVIIGSNFEKNNDALTNPSLQNLSNFVIFMLIAGFFPLTYTLKNLRKTSFMQNMGDTIVIYLIVLLPAFLHSLIAH